MSKFKLHPISSIIHFVKGLKEMLIPLVFILVANGFNFSFDVKDEAFFSEMIPLIIFVGILLVTLVNGIIKWLTFQYWFEEQELRVQYGLFVKKKRFIPFDRIQTLNYKEGIFHRPFGLMLVTVETAGSTGGKPEAEFTAITKEAAAQIEQEMNKAKGKQVVEHADVEVEEHVVFKMSALEQMTLATTSGGIGMIIFGVFAAVSQFVEYLPIDWIVDELAYLVKYGVMFIAAFIFVGLVIAWILSVVWTMISYFDFKVTVQDERIVITKGLIEKKRVTIPLNRVQAVQIHENPLRQLLGFASVQIESAGGGDKGEGFKSSVKLFPLIRKKDMYGPLRELFPHLLFDDEAIQTFTSPKKGRPFFYRLNFIWFVPTVAAVGYFLFPYGLLSIFIAVPIIAMGVWRHKTARAQIIGNQMTLTYRHISKITFIAEKQRIQVMQMSQSIFQKRRNIASAEISVKSGAMWARAKAYHMELEDIEQLMEWYQYK